MVALATRIEDAYAAGGLRAGARLDGYVDRAVVGDEGATNDIGSKLSAPADLALRTEGNDRVTGSDQDRLRIIERHRTCHWPPGLYAPFYCAVRGQACHGAIGGRSDHCAGIGNGQRGERRVGDSGPPRNSPTLNTNDNA